MAFKENLAEFLNKRRKEDPGAISRIIQDVHKTVQRFPRHRLNQLLTGQIPSQEEVESLARALKVHPRQLSASTGEDREEADIVVRELKYPEKIDKYYQWKVVLEFRKGNSKQDVLRLIADFEREDRFEVEEDVFHLPKDEHLS